MLVPVRLAWYSGSSEACRLRVLVILRPSLAGTMPLLKIPSTSGQVVRAGSLATVLWCSLRGLQTCLASTSYSWSSCRLYAYGGWRCALHFLPGIFRHWDWLCRLDIELSPVALVRTLSTALSPRVCRHPFSISRIFLIPSLCWFRFSFLASSGSSRKGDL